MQINSIDKNNFEGNFVKSRRIKNATERFVEKVINYPIEGVTNRQLLDNKTFDVLITTTGKKTVQGRPFLNFQSRFKSLNSDLEAISYKFSSGSRIEDGVEASAQELRQHILYTDTQKRRQNGYNTFVEKVKSYFKIITGFYY